MFTPCLRMMITYVEAERLMPTLYLLNTPDLKCGYLR